MGDESEIANLVSVLSQSSLDEDNGGREPSRGWFFFAVFSQF